MGLLMESDRRAHRKGWLITALVGVSIFIVINVRRVLKLEAEAWSTRTVVFHNLALRAALRALLGIRDK